jgi:acetyl-CoA acetyltransferase
MNPAIFTDENIGIAFGMGITAENVAAEWKISREEQDAFALQSHQRALAAQANGEFKDEIAPYPLEDRYPDLDSHMVVEDKRVISADEGPRRDTSAEALAQTGITQDQLDWIELNEAFAAQALAVMGDLKLDPAKVNPLGGAIALGHPLGATGAVRIATLVHGMRRRKQKYGMVTMCIGTGMGAAGIFEAL